VNSVADELAFPCPIASTSLQAYVERAARGCGGDDDASVVCNYEEITGKPVSERGIAEAAIPSPPNEPAAQSSDKPSIVLVLEEGVQADILQAADRSILVTSYSSNPTGLEQALEDASEHAVIGLSGFSSKDTLREELSVKFPNMHLVDYHLIPSPESTSQHQVSSQI
jgi:hypothetical protein